MALIYTLDPDDVKITFFGGLVTGFSEGSYVEIVYNSPRYTLVVGAGGAAVRVRSRNKSAKITFRLMPGALGNQVLQAAKRLDDFLNQGAGPLSVMDLSTTPPSTWVGPAWIEKDPSLTRSKDAADPFEWGLESHNLQDALGVGT
jgi:hypothetical protein